MNAYQCTHHEREYQTTVGTIGIYLYVVTDSQLVI